MASEIKKIILVDDNQRFIDAVKMLLKTRTKLQVVGEANNAYDFFDIIRKISADMVFMDINMPGINGLIAAKRAMLLNKNIKIIGVTMSDDYNIHIDMMRIGFMGGLLKNQFTQDISVAIQEIEKGEKYFPLLREKEEKQRTLN
jgi:DNA-binding NarL/FixJ family response regulator